MFEWNSHRFVGGVLALDLANTIVWSDLPKQRTDRFSDRSLIAAFAEAATIFRAEELQGRSLVAPRTKEDIESVLSLRLAIDQWLRPLSVGLSGGLPISDVFSACAKASAAKVSNDSSLALGEACARSSMRFLNPSALARLKRCPSCRWLYLDGSKNQSRQWCDMRVCGNRAKARTFYSRQKLAMAEEPA